MGPRCGSARGAVSGSPRQPMNRLMRTFPAYRDLGVMAVYCMPARARTLRGDCTYLLSNIVLASAGIPACLWLSHWDHQCVPAASRSALPAWSKAQGISAHPPPSKALPRGLRRRPSCFSVRRASTLPLLAASELKSQRALFQLPPMSSQPSR